MKIPFYDDYFAFPQFSTDNSAQKFKDEYIHKKVYDNFIYKFIPFTEDLALNENKIQLLNEQKLWASNYTSFKDKNELSFTYDYCKVSDKTGCTKEHLKQMINTTNEINDVSCFTYEISNYMWENYANHYNGLCLRFLLLDSDKFFPVIYLRKEVVDYTDDLIYVLRNLENPCVLGSSLSRIAILPWVLKDDQFSIENELRFLCGDVYDEEDGPMGGRVYAGKKEAMKYYGTTYEYYTCGIELNQIIPGKYCCPKYLKQLNAIQY